MNKFINEFFKITGNEGGWIATAVAVAGSLLSASSASRGAAAQASAARSAARAKRKQATELLERSKINAQRMELGGKSLTEQQTTAFAGSGVEVGTGSTISVMNDAMNRTEQSISDMLTDAEGKASALRSGANVDTQLSGQIRSAGKLQAFGSLLSGAAAVNKSLGN